MGKVDKKVARKTLTQLIRRAGHLKLKKPLGTGLFEWSKLAESRISQIFGSQSKHLEDFKDISYAPVADFSPEDNLPEDYFDEFIIGGLDEARALLRVMVDEIDNYWNDTEQSESYSDTQKVFVVFGHDKLALRSAESLLYELGLKPVKVTPGDSEGSSIIDTIELLAKDCCFALILLTPDDEVQGKQRARQNVIFEWGYFIKHLTRKRVVAAYKKGVELPSDMQGIFYYQFEDEVHEIKEDLVKRLDSCGIKHN